MPANLKKKSTHFVLTSAMEFVSNMKKIAIMDVTYLHLQLKNGDDIYITKYGLPFIELFDPENFWTDEKWFNMNSIRLAGTSCLYKIKTKEVNGISKDIVLKWNRMGQDIPVEDDFDELANSEFNSPFEEFSLVMELRNTKYELPGKIVLQRPLAIYVPSERIELWRSGRKKNTIQTLVNKHHEIKLDIYRLYAVIYEWIKGYDAARLCRQGLISEKEIKELTLAAEKNLLQRGFVVRDRKPHHIILRYRDNNRFVKDKDGKFLYGLIDYELLVRTPQRDDIVKQVKRESYLKKQKDRFKISLKNKFPQYLHSVKILNVDYVYGKTVSTDGILWVIGRDPDLFEYFLPEKWEKMPRIKLSINNEIFYTVTKDNIHLVWKFSKVGLRPDLNPLNIREKKIIDYGYNSPFEEVSLSLELGRKGIPTIYPRAIYMTGHKVEIAEYLISNNRYETHRKLRTPEGKPILRSDHDYIIIYGYWNGPDEKLAMKDSDYYEGIDALRAYKEKIIEKKQYRFLIRTIKNRLRKVGIEDLNLKGSHFLLSLDSSKNLIKDSNNIPEMRLCNFELLRRNN